MKALIGFSGFVGSSLIRQIKFDFFYRKSNIDTIQGKKFDVTICAGAPAQKWIANKNPNEDLKNINFLIKNIKNIKSKIFILISTVDVYDTPIYVDENTVPVTTNLHPYGLHRLKLEEFVKNNFDNHLIIRLPGLVGKGLKKNIIYDFLNNNNLGEIDSRAIFQFYPIKNLWKDINIALSNNLKLIHLTSTPVKVEKVSLFGFEKIFKNEINKDIIKYDFRSIHSKLFNSNTFYQYSADQIYNSIKYYAKNERPYK